MEPYESTPVKCGRAVSPRNAAPVRLHPKVGALDAGPRPRDTRAMTARPARLDAAIVALGFAVFGVGAACGGGSTNADVIGTTDAQSTVDAVSIRPNGSLRCNATECTLVCDTGFADCNGNSDDGCESNLRSTATSCGACGATCATGEPCLQGRCGCPMGMNVCGTVCANLSSDNSHCGACDRVCPGTSICQSGRCVCTAGLYVCASGCVNFNTDAMNCGNCARACTPPAQCVAGMCR